MTCREHAGRPLGTLSLPLPLLVALAVAGCPGSTSDGGITVDNYCPTFAAILCEGFRDCCDLTEMEACLDYQTNYCESGEISSIRSGFSVLDSDVAGVCFDAWRASFDDCMYDDAIGEACRFQWYGDAGVGESCRDVWYCQRGLGCALDGTDGECIELPGEGESCGESTVCRPDGLYCSYVDWMCHRQPPLGEACEYREGDNVCAAGVCDPETETCVAVSWCS